MPDVVVTGATGLIGSHLVNAVDGRANLICLGRRPPAERRDGVTWVAADLRDPALPDDLPSRSDVVVHLAQSRRFREFPDGALDVFDVNVAATARLLDYARTSGARLFVYASSGGIYGHGATHFREDDPVAQPGPLGFYLASKQAGEALVTPYSDHLVVVVLRFFFVYGPGQPEHMLLPRLAQSCHEGRPITLDGPDGISLNPVHVDDAVAALVASWRLEQSATINVAGPDVLSLRAISDEIGRAVGRQPVFAERDQPPRHLVGDTARMTELLGPPVHHLAERVGDVL